MPTPNYTTAQLLHREEIRFPIITDPTAKQFRERYVINRDNYSRTALDTAHPDSGSFSGFYLVDDQPYRKTEEHVFFALYYATIPATRDESVDLVYTFPGIADDGFGFGAYRMPLDLAVVGRATYEYFLGPNATPAEVTGATGTASTDVIAASGHPFVDRDLVTYVSGTGFDGLTASQLYLARDVVAGVSFKLAATYGGAAEDFTVDGSAGVFRRGVPIYNEQRYIDNATGYDLGYVINAGTYGATTPTKTTYLGWVAARTEIVARASSVNRYLGNIWERVTVRILPV